MKQVITFLLRTAGISGMMLLLAVASAMAQAVPEYMYYKFDAAGDQQNYASAPVGTNPAALLGLTVGSTGQFGTALIGNGLTSTSNRLNTGWATNLPSAGWTISFWLNNFPATASTTFYYFGDNTAGSFRCFTGGVAGNGNLLLRGTGLTDVPINGIPSTPTVIHLVYTGTSVKVFKNGVLDNTVAQTPATFSGAGPFLVGGYSSSNSINAGTLMDEFRMYNRALTDLEVNQTWNQPLPIVVGGPPIVVTTAATGITATTSALNGTVNANSASTTVSFEYGLTTAYGSTVAGVPATVTGTTVTPVTAAITGLLPGTTYHFRVKGVNSFGTTNGNDMTFTTPPVLPVVVTTAASSVTSTSAMLNGTVNAGGASTTVTFEYGLTTAYGTTVPGVPSPVTGNTVTPVSANITGLVINTTYHYRIVGVNSVGTANGSDMTFITTSCPMPGPAGSITGPVSVCGNSAGNVYSVTPIANATGYTWTLPAGAVITAGSNTSSITVTFGNTAGTVSVYGTNTCGNGGASNLPVTVNTAPVPTISGPVSMCVNSGYFDYVTQTGMSNYTWTVSSGGVITWGQGTSQIQVQWPGSGAQSVSVNYMNASGCYAGTATVLAVSVGSLPGSAGTITGTATTCGGAAGMGVAYSVAPVANAVTYVWNLPAGATIASGEWTNAITVDFAPDASSGPITVSGNNLCGNGAASPAFNVTVTPLPSAAGTITGDGSVCPGMTGVAYSVPAIPNATGYVWTLPAGATIASGTNTNSITVDFDATAATGVMSVKGTNSCGVGVQSPAFTVMVYPIPATPVITLNDDVLESDAPAGNQWYLEGVLIPGATGQTYTPEMTGHYTCIVTLEGCSSATSNTIYVVMTGMEDKDRSFSALLYPNPCDGQFTLRIHSPRASKFSLSVFNNLGLEIYSISGIEVQGDREMVVNIDNAPAGVYWLKVSGDNGQVTRKVIVR
jgi:hypothetical protein